MTPDDIAAALAEHGLILRGGFDFDGDGGAPLGPTGALARAVLLVGQAGASAWPAFLKWRDREPGRIDNPLDTWSREVIGAVAEKCGARAVSPSEKPYLPFQQWAVRAERLKPSPLGILMHPRYGLWHAYRGALLFERRLALAEAEALLHLCDACAGKPCMKACPAGAHSAAGFDHAACLAHVRGSEGSACMRGGCLDRNACPNGTAYRYPADMQAFHMSAFAGR